MALTHDISHTIGFFIVGRSLLFIIKTLNELFGGVAEETTHSVYDPHRISLVVFTQKYLKINSMKCHFTFIICVFKRSNVLINGMVKIVLST